MTMIYFITAMEQCRGLGLQARLKILKGRKKKSDDNQVKNECYVEDLIKGYLFQQFLVHSDCRIVHNKRQKIEL